MSEEEEYLRSIARKHVIRRTGFQIHFIVFIFTNILILGINLLTATYPTVYLWSLWVFTAWFVGMLYHAFTYFRPKSSGFAWHFFSFVVVNCYLIFVYYFSNATDYPWVLWPMGGWGIGLLTHWLIHIARKPKVGEDATKSWLDRKIDKELETIQAQSQPGSENRVCKQCGFHNNLVLNFCAQCGHDLKN